MRSDDALIPVGERAGRLLLTWGPRWWPVLEAFAAHATGELTRSTYTAIGTTWYGQPPQLVYDLDSLPPSLRDDIGGLAAALHAQPSPEDGVVFLTDMTTLTGPSTGRLLSVLAQCLQDQIDDTAAVHVPIGGSEYDGTFPLHADLFRAQLLLTIAERPAATEGATWLARTTDVLEALAGVLDADTITWLEATYRYQHWSFSDMARAQWEMFGGSRRDASLAAVAPILETHQLWPGSGYFIHDGTWLHGRGFLSEAEEDKVRRVHRLNFDNETTLAARRPAVAEIDPPQEFLDSLT